MRDVTFCEEEDAARALRDLAVALQSLLFYYEGGSLSNRSQTILGRSYRHIKPTVDFYFDTDNPLCWNGPALGRPFKKSK
jgi:hypothetical protein